MAPVRQFARNLGVAFQILNDLNDWRGDQHNKLSAGGDILGGRPTVLWALALEALDASRSAGTVDVAGERGAARRGASRAGAAAVPQGGRV